MHHAASLLLLLLSLLLPSLSSSFDFTQAEGRFPSTPLLSSDAPKRVAWTPQGVGPPSGGGGELGPELYEYIRHHFYDVYVHSGEFADIRSVEGVVESVASFVDDAPFDRVALGFEFPFYGHPHESVYISANGFVSMIARYCFSGFCNWSSRQLNESLYIQYVAPLMSDWNPRQYGQSTVHYVRQADEDGKSLVVQWTDVVLYHPSPEPWAEAQHKAFTFQTELRDDGTIRFSYDKVPFDPISHRTNFSTRQQDVVYPRVTGVEDAITWQDGAFTYYITYKPLDIPYAHVLEKSTTTFRARETCLSVTDCGVCINATITEARFGLRCGWCRESNLCTDGVGRETLDLDEGCANISRLIENPADCSLPPVTGRGGSEGSSDDSTESLEYGLGFGLALGSLITGLICYKCVRRRPSVDRRQYVASQPGQDGEFPVAPQMQSAAAAAGAGADADADEEGEDPRLSTMPTALPAVNRSTELVELDIENDD